MNDLITIISIVHKLMWIKSGGLSEETSLKNQFRTLLPFNGETDLCLFFSALDKLKGKVISFTVFSK